MLTGHSDRVTSVCLSSSGLRVVSVSDDTTVRVWDAESGVCLCIGVLDAPASGVDMHADHICCGDEFGGVHCFAIECDSEENLKKRKNV